jgi:DNA polymerase
MNPMDVLKFEPDHMVYIDFETYYDPKNKYSLTPMTNESYIRDERFQVIGVGVQVDDEPPEWLEEHEFRSFAAAMDWSKCTVVAHNTPFDGFIMAWHYGIVPGGWVDTLSMARAKHGTTIGNSLAKLMAYYGIGTKGHEVENVKGKRREDFTMEEWLRYGEYCKTDVGGTRDLLPLLAEGFPEIEFWVVDATIRMFTEPAFVLDEPFLEEYLVYERARKAELMRSIAGLPEGATDAEVATKVKPVLMSNEKFAKLLIMLGVVPPRKISVAKTKLAGEPVLTWAFAKSDPGMQDLLEHENTDIRMVAEARVGVKSTINESRTVRMLRMGKDGRILPVQLNCYAAHTGRHGGAGKMNWQNLERVLKPAKGVEPTVKQMRSGALRKAVKAPLEDQIVVVDSAAVEARGTAWLAEDDSLVAEFAEGKDVYSRFASTVFGRTITKKDVIERALGKVSILGLGYSMGWLKFAMTLAAGPMGNDPIIFTMKEAEEIGVDVEKFTRDAKKMARVEDMPSRLPLEDRAIHCAVCEHVVKLYRQENVCITELWAIMDGVLEAMMDEEEFSFGPDGVFTTERHAIRLPSGRLLRYPGLEEDDGAFSYLGDHKQRTHLYGGKLTENVVQAFCRDVVVWQMLWLQGKYGYRAKLFAHDEIVLVVPKVEAPVALHRAVEVMKMRPYWAPGLPVSAEGGFAQSYGSAK